MTEEEVIALIDGMTDLIKLERGNTQKMVDDALSQGGLLKSLVAAQAQATLTSLTLRADAISDRKSIRAEAGSLPRFTKAVCR